MKTSTTTMTKSMANRGPVLRVEVLDDAMGRLQPASGEDSEEALKSCASAYPSTSFSGSVT